MELSSTFNTILLLTGAGTVFSPISEKIVAHDVGPEAGYPLYSLLGFL
jgi:hypothetical protein